MRKLMERIDLLMERVPQMMYSGRSLSLDEEVSIDGARELVEALPDGAKVDSFYFSGPDCEFGEWRNEALEIVFSGAEEHYTSVRKWVFSSKRDDCHYLKFNGPRRRGFVRYVVPRKTKIEVVEDEERLAA